MLAKATRRSNLMELAINVGTLQQGYQIQPGRSTRGLQTIKPKRIMAIHGRPWLPEEDTFIRQNLGWLSDAEMGEILNRTKTAVHLRWTRELHIVAPSKNPNVITAEQASRALGLDSHKICHWVDKGLIPGRRMAGDRTIRLIKRISFMIWVCSPKNWVYFDIKKVQDPHLKRLLALRAKRWGDEWWSTRKAADYHGLDTSDIKRYIQLGRIKSFRLPVSLTGRYIDRKWSNHYLLKSDVIKMKVYKGMGRPLHTSIFTPRADRWLLHARDKLHWSYIDIGRSMKIGKVKTSKAGVTGTNEIVAGRYHYLKLLAARKESNKKHEQKKAAGRPAKGTRTHGHGSKGRG